MKKQTKSTLLENSDCLFDTYESKKAALVLRAVNNKTRQQIIKILYNWEKEKMYLITVTELYVSMRIEQAVASQHLAILRRAKIVNTKRDGKFIYYSVNTTTLNKLHKNILEINSL